MRLRTLGAACAACAVAASSSPAHARYSPGVTADRADVPADMRRAAKRVLVERHMFLARRLGHVRGNPLSEAQRHRKRVALHALEAAVLHASNRRLLRTIREARARRAAGAADDPRSPQGAPNVAIPAQLAAIAQCESGGNPAAVSSNGMYHGKYQFSVATWAAVGGTGLPSRAPEAEQDMRAAMLYARSGPGQWPTCGL